MIYKNYKDLSTGYLQQSSRFLWVSNILIIFLFLSACSSPSRNAPIYTRPQPASTKVVTHIVAPGETLYSIAWRYHLDYKNLAKNNGIERDYRIFPGQIIHLNDRVVLTSRSTHKNTPAPPSRPPATHTGASRQQSVPKRNTLPPASVGKPVTTDAPVRSEKKSNQPKPATTLATANTKIAWRWPAQGKVLTDFSDKKALRKGIDIAGKKGEAVRAAAPGQVVYAGSGLRGYGKLVIIKHSETYLSAYAHNHQLRVKEGDSVTAGQRIADIGASGTGTNGKPKLHFQIRRDGKPVNPIRLLPKRR